MRAAATQLVGYAPTLPERGELMSRETGQKKNRLGACLVHDQALSELSPPQIPINGLSRNVSVHIILLLLPVFTGAAPQYVRMTIRMKMTDTIT